MSASTPNIPNVSNRKVSAMKKAVVFSLAAITVVVSVAEVFAQHVQLAGYYSDPSYSSLAPLDTNRYATIEVTPMPAVIRTYQDPSRAHFQLLLPDPETEVWFEGVITRQFGDVRYYYTPTLPAGESTYTIRARWSDGVRVQDQRREVQVRPGQSVTVNFRIR
jgi:uncharacterized protein (TIGR03000 family)